MKTSPGVTDFLKEHTPSLSLAFRFPVVLVPYRTLSTMQGLVVTDDIFTGNIMNESFPYCHSLSRDLKNGACPRVLARAHLVGKYFTATVENYSTNEVIVAVSSDAAGLPVLSDTFYRSWEAEVDGNPARILRANLCQRAVEVHRDNDEI